MHRKCMRLWWPILRYFKGLLGWATSDYSLRNTEAFIHDSIKKYHARLGFAANIMLNGQMAGNVSCKRIDQDNRIMELGYWLVTSCYERGIMAKASRYFISIVFKELKLPWIEIWSTTKFAKEGMRWDGEWIHDHFNDLVLYRLLKREWSHSDH